MKIKPKPHTGSRRNGRSGYLETVNSTTGKVVVEQEPQPAPKVARSSNAVVKPAYRPGVRPTSASLGYARLLVLLVQAPLVAGFPIMGVLRKEYETSSGKGPVAEPGQDETSFWAYMTVSACLVLLGGIFAGLTLALMGQDEVYLQVMKDAGNYQERKNASKVLNLLKKSKHWVLVTLLLSNVITNETLPVVLDRCLGGGWPAVVSSTVSIVIFGEIIPQSICVRYGLEIGASLSSFVLVLMYVLYPLAYPVALLLDYSLGEDHGTMYNRAGLRTLVTLHGHGTETDHLNADEVTIITAVLQLKEKPVKSIMTPIEDVFVLPSNQILDQKTVDMILHMGFNRIPIHAPNEPTNFIGMLLVRILIRYDPEDAQPISEFPLATLPETGPETSCLNILNYFQEGKSHMIVVSNKPGDSTGAIGILTLEDVIEELIGEEIVDESDVYVDVHKAVRRAQPGPLRGLLGYGTAGKTVRSQRQVDSMLDALASIDNNYPRFGPKNRAANPTKTKIPNVTIKKAIQNVAATSNGSDLVDAAPSSKIAGISADEQTALLSVPNSLHGGVHRTESSAIREGLRSPPNSNGNGNGNGNADNSWEGDLGHSGENAEAHSYSVGGGIIESVVERNGFSKTVIEEQTPSVSSTSSQTSHHDHHNRHSLLDS